MDGLETSLAANLITEVFKYSFSGLKEVETWLWSKTSGAIPIVSSAFKYSEHIEAKYNSIKIFGMDEPVPLRNIYVKVNILKKITARRKISIESLEEQLDHDKKSFGQVQLSEPGIDTINRLQKIIILGKPGAGKSTFLKRLLFYALDGQINNHKIPIFISLKDWSESDLKLIDYIVEQFDICDFKDKQKDLVIRMLNKGKCLLILDGFDEVTKNINSAINEIRRITDKYHKNNFVLSCRIASYNYVFDKFTDVEIADFTSPQIEKFIYNWFRNNTKTAKLCVEKINDPINKSIKELSTIPLLLTMACLAFEDALDFPANRTELYNDALNALLKKWDSSKGIKRESIYGPLSSGKKINMLSLIAARTFENDQYFIRKEILECQIEEYVNNLPQHDYQSSDVDCEDILKSIESQHGLIVERADKIYSFSHLTFQEYFTATYIKDNEARGSLIQLSNNLFDEHYTEVIIMTANMITNADIFLISILNKTIDYAGENELEELVTEIYSVLLQKEIGSDKIYGNRIYAINQAFISANTSHSQLYNKIVNITDGILSSIGSIFSFDNTIDFNRLQKMRGLLENIAADKAENICVSLIPFIKGSKVIYDCLSSDCYISKNVRIRIQKDLLTVKNTAYYKNNQDFPFQNGK